MSYVLVSAGRDLDIFSRPRRDAQFGQKNLAATLTPRVTGPIQNDVLRMYFLRLQDENGKSTLESTEVYDGVKALSDRTWWSI